MFVIFGMKVIAEFCVRIFRLMKCSKHIFFPVQWHRAFAGVLVALCWLSWSPAQAQSDCTAYERELQALFSAYQPGNAPPIQRAERVWERCVDPTPAMQLSYYYFKAVEALTDSRLSPRMAYLDAAHYYYDRSVPQFTYLVQDNAAADAFIEQYIKRSHQLETTLMRREKALGINPNQRYRYQPNTANAEGEWLKNDLDPGDATGSAGTLLDRGQGSPIRKSEGSPFGKRIRQGDAYQSFSRASSPTPTGKEETYGVVGNLDALGLMEYLRWRGQYRSVGAPDNGAFKTEGQTAYQGNTYQGQARGAPAYSPARQMAVPRGNDLAPANHNPVQTPEMGVNYDPAIGPTPRRTETPYGQPRGVDPSITRSLAANSANVELMINVMAPLILRAQPNHTAATVDILEFGEPVDLLLDENMVVANSVPYVMVRTPNGETGWVEQHSLIADGTVAAVLSNVQTYTQPNGSQAGRILNPGELVVLADTRGDWIKLMTRNGEHEVWAYGRQAFSITANDIAIADAYQEARMLADPHMRKVNLQRIRQANGYQSSPLRPVVEAAIQRN